MSKGYVEKNDLKAAESMLNPKNSNPSTLCMDCSIDLRVYDFIPGVLASTNVEETK